MRLSVIFTKDNRDSYEVTCEFADWLNSPHWNVYVSKKPKGKRKFRPLVDEDDWRYRNAVNRTEYRYNEYAKEIPWEWVRRVMSALTSQIKELGYSIYPKNQ